MLVTKNKSGSSLLSLVIAMIALCFVILSGFGFYEFLNARVHRVEQRMNAVGLAVSQVEDLLSREYSDSPALDVSATSKSATITDIPDGFTVTYVVSNGFAVPSGVSKKIAVTCSHPPDTWQIQLTAYRIQE